MMRPLLGRAFERWVRRRGADASFTTGSEVGRQQAPYNGELDAAVGGLGKVLEATMRSVRNALRWGGR
jgi:hypothetical protein